MILVRSCALAPKWNSLSSKALLEDPGFCFEGPVAPARHHVVMGTVFIGSEAVAAGLVTRGQLRRRYNVLFPDVYQPAVAETSLYNDTVGAWLWSRRRGVITGRAAGALHGARWVDEGAPIELIWNNNHPPARIIARNERFAYDEVWEMHGMAVASPQRTAFDLARFLPRVDAVAHLDALARATGLAFDDVRPVIDSYKGARHRRRCLEALDLMDAGAQSPKESWLRLLLMDDGYPRLQTQIPVLDDSGYPFAYLDMGWEDMMIAVEYDGDQHRTDRRQYRKDILRQRKVERSGWINLRVVKEDRRHNILTRVREAWAQRETEGRVVRRSA
jgi:very-short-patch-repair endonuclease